VHIYKIKYSKNLPIPAKITIFAVKYGNKLADKLDGNGRVGRLLMFKECLANHIVPFIITDELKMFYYRGLKEWGHINGYLTDTCLTAQDIYKELLRYFRL